MTVTKNSGWHALYLCVVVLLVPVLLGGCSGGGDDADVFSDYDMTPSVDTDSRQRCCDDEEVTLPNRIDFSEDGRRLVSGIGAVNDFYEFSTEDDSDIKRIDLFFDQDDWWTQLEDNYASETEIPAAMTYDGETLESVVGVRFKGMTSYMWNPTEKKSFNISIDYLDAGQDLNGINTLNLNCAWGDDTFMREVIYEHINQRYIPAVSVNYVDLYINGDYWGIYINSQQLDGNFIEEWFTSPNGTRWRAANMGGGGGRGNDGGPVDGDGTDGSQFPEGETADDAGTPEDGERPGTGGGPPDDGETTDDAGTPEDGERPGRGGGPPDDGETTDDAGTPEDDERPGRGGGPPDDGETTDDAGTPEDDERPGRGGGPPGNDNLPGGFGGGTSALNYLGDASEDYTASYDLQRYCWSDPWDDLINVCYALENTPTEEMESEISKYLDLDRTLWFLIMENIFADEDSYVNKGAMDFYLYWNDATGLMVPLEYDGNSVLLTTIEMGGLSDDFELPEDFEFPEDIELPEDFEFPEEGPVVIILPPGGGPGGGMNLINWSPFNNADSENYPLLYKLLNVQSIRQRYLAHMRTVLNESFNQANLYAMIDAYALKIGPHIEADPKTFIIDFEAGIDDLKEAVATRLNALWSNEELNVTGLAISDVKWIVGAEAYASPSSTDDVQEVIITATVQDLENGGGVDSVFLYVGEGIEGPFTKVQMTPEGSGVYTSVLAEESAGVRTRFYIEAVAGDEAGTRTYYPSGAAHDVFTFQVGEIE